MRRKKCLKIESEESEFLRERKNVFFSVYQQVYDFGEKVIMSGLIDANVNISVGGECEDFGSTTKAAGAGGYTCIVDNPL